MTGTILVFFVLILGIVVHEFGHLLAAKLFRVKVTVFSVFFWTPKKLMKYLSFRFRGTTYKLGLLPLGGFVRMKGMFREDTPPVPMPVKEYFEKDNGLESTIVAYDNKDDDAFINKPVWQRAIILSMGSLTNIFLGFIFFTLAFMQGYESYTNDIVGVKGTPFYKVEKKPVKIIYVNNKRVRTFKDIVESLDKASKDRVDITYILCGKKDCKQRTVSLKPKKQGKRYIIGIRPSGKTYKEKFSFLQSLSKGAKLTATFPYEYFRRLPTVKKSDVSGPVGIVHTGSQFYKQSTFAFYMFCGMLMMLLGIFNLLPIPPMDGGHLLFLAVEKVRGKALSLYTQNKISLVIMIALIVLSLYICNLDISRVCLSNNGAN
jgi:regulator of sigma E protease